ncbi:hypothetical protein D8674_015164 [Pyrus ussuriensis x Pyrus communis]|uniref:Uncharacterized protein n=1 Tax=Pyrus ussuriensis x Pyrus communis TaxID=2448454 RepID=A0A5N5GUK6_9ROSA|nr:hypothetical protein D8674_015164 [Pyrus ussuriensis x Pyrus communis]
MPTPRTFKPLSRHIDMPSKVPDIKIEMCFNPTEAGSILCMALSKYGCSDSLIWHYNRNGMYSIKSGYLVAQ